MAGNAYAGIKRRKQTPWSVRVGDALVSRIIAVGGIGTIAAISLVVLVLLGTALPLFRTPRYQAWRSVSTAAYQQFAIDENGLLLWGLTAAGQLEVRNLNNGEVLSSLDIEIAPGTSITSSALTIDRSQLVLGFSNGTFQVAELGFETSLLSPQDLPAGVGVSRANPVVGDGTEIYQWFDAKGVRRVKFKNVEWSDPKQLGDAPVTALDYLPDNSANLLASSTSSHVLAVVGDQLVFATISGKKNMLTRQVTETLESIATSLQSRSTDGRPLSVTLLNGTDFAVVAWPNATLDRFALSNGEPRLVESQIAAVNTDLNVATPLLARQTLLCGLEDGRLQGWMITRPPESETALREDDEQEPSNRRGDGWRLSLAHEVIVGDHPLVAAASSRQSHVAITADRQGQIALTYVTTNSLLGREQYPFEGRIIDVAFDSDGDDVIVIGDRSMAVAHLELGHPEASLKGYFGKVWYEGHNMPKYIWQSSAATEEAELKLSLMPLVFGTLKATFYAMMISVPLAILAAIYTSEFLSARLRSRIKPAIEMMASLPSVVLGYIAALVLAPYLQAHLMAILLSLFVLPFTFVVVGNLWNIVPVERVVRMHALRLPVLILCLPLGVFLAAVAAPLCERWLFEGNLLRWLSGSEGTGVGGWVLLLTPLLALVVSWLLIGPLSDWTRRVAIARSPRSYALLALVRLFCLSCLVLVLAYAIGWLLSQMGFDLRNSLFGTYQDRNALLVGFALGFCVIPIIYTISDDALQSVPQQLRSASLGCGATPWQTTVRVVVPSAMSGLFSAVMIGLGRAVGETMVVLCAAGNTPLMEVNLFNGFKTLSAALATELPEAAKGSTHFRTLFMAALLLFAMTLVANTLAELVRIRFRKRTSQL